MPKLTLQDSIRHCATHGRHWGPFCAGCSPEMFAPSSEEVEVGGVQLFGKVTRDAIPAVKKFIEGKGFAPTVRLDRVVCTADAPATLATSVDLRRGWRWEAVVGLPDAQRGPTRWAKNALRFEPGWDTRVRSSADVDSGLYVDSEGEIREAIADSDIYDRVDGGVLPPNLDPNT